MVYPLVIILRSNVENLLCVCSGGVPFWKASLLQRQSGGAVSFPSSRTKKLNKICRGSVQCKYDYKKTNNKRFAEISASFKLRREAYIKAIKLGKTGTCVKSIC